MRGRVRIPDKEVGSESANPDGLNQERVPVWENTDRGDGTSVVIMESGEGGDYDDPFLMPYDNPDYGGQVPRNPESGAPVYVDPIQADLDRVQKMVDDYYNAPRNLPNQDPIKPTVPYGKPIGGGSGQISPEMQLLLDEIAMLKEQLKLRSVNYGGSEVTGYGNTRATLYRAPRLILAGYDPDEIKVAEYLRAHPELMAKDKNALQKFGDTMGLFWGKNAVGIPNIDEISGATGIPKSKLEVIMPKLLAAGASGLLMALTGNFPVAAMGYFALDRMLDPNAGRELFNGAYTNESTLDGRPIIRMGIEVPEGLPNEVFGAYRFTCYDHLTGSWWPTDEINVNPATGGVDGAYRWLCLDRVSGRVYHANAIKKPRIYL